MYRLAVIRRVIQDNGKLVSNVCNGFTTIRSYAGTLEENIQVMKKNISFKQMIKQRREEAHKSVLVQVNSEQSCGSLLNYITKISNVKTMLHFQSKNSSHFVLVELMNQNDYNLVMDHAIHFQPHEVVPVQSPLMWFRAVSDTQPVLEQAPRDIVSFHNSISVDDKEKLDNYLLNADTLSHQMELLYDKTKLTEIGVRLRFLTAKQIELGLCGLFPHVSVLPFGSSVNGFGKNDCDLDLVLEYSDYVQNDKSRLIYHAKSSLINERIQIQHHIEIIGDLLQLFMPGCTNVKKILHARVPIIKFKQELTGLECDLSLSSVSSVQMSELLYTYSMMDKRVKCLIFTIRYWAKIVGLTNSAPGRWITNFSLTLLALFFLQQKHNDVLILPTINDLKNYNKLTNFDDDTHNLESLESLLLRFFNFYSQFDFSTHGISLINGNSVSKPDYSALYIVNPLQPELNVSKNVSLEEVEHLKIEMKEVYTLLSESCKIIDTTSEHNSDVNWGLVKLLERQCSNKKAFYFQSKSRLIDVQSLFDESEDSPSIVKKEDS